MFFYFAMQTYIFLYIFAKTTLFMKHFFPLFIVFCFLFVSCCNNSLTKSDTSVSCGNIYRFNSFYEGFGDSLTFEVWTPDGYKAGEKYPVLYMHDGQMLFDAETTWNKKAWEMDDTAGRLIASDSVRPFIIVGIFNLPTRLCDYLPSDIDSMMAEGGEKEAMKELFSSSKKRGGEYVDAIVYSIKPFVDSLFYTDASASATAIAGSSMGGLISLYAFCKYPDVFGSAICMSTHFSTSATRPELANAEMQYALEHMPDAASHKIYFDNGTMPCDDAYTPFFFKMVKLFEDNGYGKESLLYREFPGQWHSESDWASRVHIPLYFIFGK